MTGYSVPELDTNGYERAKFGLIATARETTTGRLASRHEGGPPTGAALALAAWVDRLGPDWRILSLSTPVSIYRDLQGDRSSRRVDDQPQPSDPRTAEASLLGRIGRLDLLAPLENPGSDVRGPHYRKRARA